MPQELLKDIVHNGVVIDIFNAEEAFNIEDVIGTNATDINGATYGHFFGPVQIFLINSLILTVAKIYEKPKNKYVIRSIPSALRILEENADELDIPERPTLNSWFISRGYNKEVINNLSNADITRMLVQYFNERMPEAVEDTAEELDRALHAVKTTRDKRISHNEQIPNEAVPRPTYQELTDLLALAKEFAGAIGLPYLSTVYEDDKGNYLLSSDSGRSSRCLKRILKKLEVVT
ncbi:hypothetical protein [Endozoicomonas atrinae]|uniref:AbiU2 domain-containing protein n=1 Tax=Endozoicomonas atrinae TaxID=1333660 RepID=UPI003B003869